MSVIEFFQIDAIVPYIPNIIVITFLLILLAVLNMFMEQIFRNIRNSIRSRFDITISTWVVKLMVNLLIIFLILVNIPGINDTILTTLGYISAAIIAFSSSTIIGNAMSGIMIKLIKSYKPGDVVKTAEHFGKVAHVKMLHTLLETADKRLVYVPNSTVITGGITNYSRDHPIVNVSVSIGYNIERIEVEKLLITAAKNAGLEKVFVTVKELGNYSITYEVNGLLQKVETLPFVESNVRKNILDQFHLAQKEILSPQYIEHRVAPDVVVPKVNRAVKKEVLDKEKREKKAVSLQSKVIYKEAEELVKKK